MKKTVAGIAVVVILVSAAILYRRYEARRAHMRLAHEAAEVMWHGFLTQFQNDCPLGTQRSEVKKYLDSKDMAYIDFREITVNLGQEPADGFVCDSWTVYVSFEFGLARREVEPSALDALTSISLKRIGHCL